MPSPPLLRTHRAFFNAIGSSISKAFRDRETRIGDIPTLHDTHVEPSPVAETGMGAPANDTTALRIVAAICFPTWNGLPHFLVTRHLLEVCPLACGAKFELLSIPLQNGFRFLQHPLPAAPSARLTARFPEGRAAGLPRFVCIPTWVRSRLSAGGTTSATGEVRAPILDHLPFGPGLFSFSGLFSTFGLLELTAFISDSHMLTLPGYPDSRPPWC